VVCTASETGGYRHQVIESEAVVPVVPMAEWLVLGKQRIDRSLRTKLDAAVASNANQNGAVGLAGGTGIVRLLSGVTVEILLEHQLAVARDEKTVNIERVVLQVGGQDFLDDR